MEADTQNMRANTVRWLQRWLSPHSDCVLESGVSVPQHFLPLFCQSIVPLAICALLIFPPAIADIRNDQDERKPQHSDVDCVSGGVSRPTAISLDALSN